MYSPSGIATISKLKISEIGVISGIKSDITLKKHLKWLASNGYLTYHEDTGYLRHYSLFRRFNDYKTGIKFFHGQKIQKTLFAGLALWLIHRSNFLQTRGKSAIKGRAKNAPEWQVKDGVSLSYLAEVLEYSRIRISQFKHNHQIKVTHRFSDKNRITSDYRELIREFVPEEGKKLVRKPKPNGKRSKTIVRQLTDKFEFSGVQLVTRRKIA